MKISRIGTTSIYITSISRKITRIFDRKNRENATFYFIYFRSQCSPGSQPQYLGSGLAHLLRPQGPFQSLAGGASAQWIWCDSTTRSLVPAGSWTSEIRHSTFHLFRHFQFRLLGLFAAFGLFRTHHTQSTSAARSWVHTIQSKLQNYDFKMSSN